MRFVFKSQQVAAHQHRKKKGGVGHKRQRRTRARGKQTYISIELLCSPPVGRRSGFLDTCLCCLVLVCFFIGPLAVCSRSSGRPTWANFRKKKRKHASSDFSAIHHRVSGVLLTEKETKHDRTCSSTLFFSSSFYILTSIFHELICFVAPPPHPHPSPPVTPTVLNSSGSNTSCAPPINHQGAWQTNHLLMKRGQPWISNCICLIYQARSNNENPNKL